MPSPKEFSDLLDELVDGAISATDARILRAQNRQYGKVLELIKGLGTDSSGGIKNTQKNIKIVNAIKKALPGIVKDDLYVGAVEKYTDEFEKIQKAVNSYLSTELGAIDPSNKLFQEVIDNAITLTNQTLLESGIETAVVDDLAAMLTSNVTTGARWVDMVAQTKEFLTNTEAGLGRLASYSKLFVNDAINQFSRNYMQVASADLGIVFYLYSGGTVADTRDFCELRNGHIFHIDEIKKWGSGAYHGPGTNGRGKWQGRNKFTTQSNIFILLGGYNCMHRLIPASEGDVGKSDRSRMESANVYKFK